MNKNSYFKYNDGKDVIPKNTFRIAPSQLSKFFDFTSEWYREQLLKEEGFTGSTATELGTCVHAAAEMYTKHKKIDHALIKEYINTIKDPEIDKNIILEQYPIMADVLISEFLSKNSTDVETEMFVHAEVLPGVVAAGSIDRYDKNKAGGTITDYKTMGSLDKARVPKSFPRAYYFQQLTYAWILRNLGYPVNYVELVYVSRNTTGRFNDKGKALKDYPSQVNIIKEPITDENMAFIESVLKLVSESVIVWKDNPELQHLLMQDYRYKAKKPHKLFIKD